MKSKFYRKVLTNGMTILFEKRSNPVVSVAFAVRCGGENESSSEKGISHFIEHMLYKGTPKRSAKMISKQIEEKGGDLNGFTSEAITAFHCKIPSKHINIALDVLSDMVKNSLFDEKEVEKEKQIIFEEIKLHQDNPIKYVFEGIQDVLYEKPFGVPLIGTYKTLGSLTRKKIVERFKQVYQPNNMILCVVGNANFDKIIDFAKKNFGNTKGKIPKFKILKRNKSKIEKRRGIDQANLIFAHHVPTFKEKKNYAAFALNILMAGGLSSRLFQEIREKRNLAYAIQGESNIGKEFAYNLIYVGAKKENVDLIKKLILDEFEKVSKELDEKELSQIKGQIIGNHFISIEDSQNQMGNLLLYEINSNAKELYEFEKKIRAVKLKDVKELAKIKKYSFFALLPQ
ncbi:MAG TPA: pitrilysin family protein [Bacillota bacterium]|nr:pitrilysin family protein [Bacillota bacterium]